MTDVLLLNSNATPVSFLPLSAITWQDAVRFLWLDVVDVLHSYDDWQVHSPSVTMTVPSVVMLRKHVRNYRAFAIHDTPQAHLVFLRDMFTCQYCGKQFARKQLTIDHVVPRSHGGRTIWRNVTSSCSPCNGRRGCDVSIQPMSTPYQPTYGALVRNMRQFHISIPHMAWSYYLGWTDEKIRLRKQNQRSIHDHFDIGIRLSLL